MYSRGATLSEDALSAFDPDGARERMGVDHEGFGRVFEYIWREVSERRPLLEAAWQAGNVRETVLHAHTIKSAAATIGAEGLSRAAAAVETAALAEDARATEAALAALRAARDKLSRLVGLELR
jgi:HPt (histidine-containing phosphotransfer) domain-containing protein